MARDDDRDEQGFVVDEPTYDHLIYDLGIEDDRTAMDLLYTGWFDGEVSADERVEARDFLFEYLDIDPGDFDWDAWREWYGEAA